jgi:hypothetical protein
MEKNARPWDLYRKGFQAISDELHDERMEICRSCEFFIKASGQCKKCLCFMHAKTKIPSAFCPEHKWGKVEIK